MNPTPSTGSSASRSRLRPAADLTALTAAHLLVLTACGSGSASQQAGAGSSGSGTQAAGTSLAQVRKAGVLTVGTEGTYRPFSYHAGGNGSLAGYDVDLVRAVAKKLGVGVKFEETQWDAIFAGLDAGRFDVIANQVSINPERKAKYAFSTPYTVSRGVVVTTADDSSIKRFSDLSGKTTAQSLTSNWYELAKQAGANVQPVEGWAQAVTLLEQGRVDATVNDQLTFLDYQKSEHDAGLKIATQTSDEARNAFAFRKGSGSLVAAVDKALAQLRADGTIARISQRYFGKDVSR
jgi:cystine transport system substrate-binding protein